MQPSDIAALNNYLQRLYGDRYPGLTTDLAALWYDQIRPFSLEVGLQAIRRWALDHLPTQAPTPNQITELMELIQREQRRQQLAVVQEAERYAQPARDDDLGVQEVRDLVRTIWPDLYAVPVEQTPEEQEARRELLRRQARELRRMAAEEGL